MALSNNQRDYFVKNAQSFIYIFLQNADLQHFNETVKQKRADQIAYIVAVKTNGYDEARELIRQTLVEKFGKEPRQILIDLYKGKKVNYKNEVAGIGALGTYGSDVASHVIYREDINAQTGFPVSDNAYFSQIGALEFKDKGSYSLSNPYKPITIGNNSSTMDSSTGKPIGVFDTTTGAQISAWDDTTNTFISGSESTGEKGNFWVVCVKVMNWLAKIISFFAEFFTNKKLTEVSAVQSDGWNAVSSTSAGSMIKSAGIIGAGILLFTVAMPAKKNKKKKKR